MTRTLRKYFGREGSGKFRPMTFNEVTALGYGDHPWILSNAGDARRVKVNGTPKRWKRDRERVEVPIKYGMYECARWGRAECLARFLVEVI